MGPRTVGQAEGCTRRIDNEPTPEGVLLLYEPRVFEEDVRAGAPEAMSRLKKKKRKSVEVAVEGSE